MSWKAMLETVDIDELVYQVAYDALEAEPAKAPASAAPAPALIDLMAPDVYEQIKRRLGMRP
jgi:hypothetical protein